MSHPMSRATSRVLSFTEAMSSFPSGVTIATTTDADGRRWGFTASSFCSVSMEPPLVLVCLARTAECHAAFAAAERLAIHIVAPTQADLAMRFATRGVDKFADSDFEVDPHGTPVLRGASVVLGCTLHAQHEAGDHTILVARVETAHATDDAPAVYFRRRFHPLGSAS